MRSIEITAKTVQEAVETALKELKLQKEDVEITVLEEPSKGLFGLLGSRMAKVKVTQLHTPKDVAVDFLKNIFTSMGMKVGLDVKENGDVLNIAIKGSQLGILIGRRGETLDSLQYLTNLVVNRNASRKYHVILDIEGYRGRREQTLIKLAQRLSEKVKRTGASVVLEPMNPQERRIIHTALQNNQYVKTYSEGEEPYRKVVIAMKSK